MWISRRTSVLFVSLLFSMVELSPAVAANRTPRIDDLDNIVFEGSISDVSGAAIGGATVIVINTSTGARRSSQSGSDGRYRILVFEPGSYALKVVAAGFVEENRTFTQLVAGRKVPTDFSLYPAGANSQMTVHASDAAGLDITRTVAGATIDRRDIDDLPLFDRDSLQLVFLLGGVTEAPLSTESLADEGSGRFFRSTPEEAGVFSLTGAQATSNNLTIDGLDNNDDRAARERVSLNPESVAEVQVITNQYAAEYGRASGGRINIRTRGGSNKYRGEGSLYFGDESLNANTFYRNARGLGRVPQQQRRGGGVFSGPMKRDKDFFFVGYERSLTTDSATINVLVPSQQNPLFPLPLPNQPAPASGSAGPLIEDLSTPETRNLVDARFDLTFSQSHNSTVRFDIVRGANKRGFPGGTRLADTLLVQGRNSDSISTTDNLIISPRFVNQSRFQVSRLLPRNSDAADSVGVVIEQPPLNAGSFTGSNSAPAFARLEHRWQGQETLTFASGSHVTKTGSDAQLVSSSFTDLYATGGIFTFRGVDDFLANVPSRFQQRTNTESRASNSVLGVFAQDEWRLKPNLTLSLGIRWDRESILDDTDNFSPRIGISWDPFGGGLPNRLNRLSAPGKTVLRAGFGLFYNRALLRTIDDFSLGKSSLLIDSDINPAVLEVVRFPSPITDSDTIARLGLRETQFLRRVSPSIEIPYTVQSGLGIEREVTRSLVVTADYIYTRGAHLWRETNVNAPVLPPGFSSLTEYLLSRDFDNRPIEGRRPVSGASADVVHFDLSSNTSSTAGAIRVVNGIRVLTLGLNAPRSSNISAALNALRNLRPDPALTQVELLESTGNSFYHGGIFSVRYSLGDRGRLRLVYTISKFIDEGTTNTASPQDLADRRAERSLSLQDQRHRLVFSGAFQVPGVRFDVAPVLSWGSSKPFNIGAGFDRNLNDIPNDRPNFLGVIERPRWRRPGNDVDNVRESLMLAPIGSNGNLPRNYGRGPGTRTVNLRVSRTFALRNGLRIRPAIDVFNLFNNTVFSFGSEFIDRDDATFLVPQRTQRARTINLSLRLTW